MLGSLPKNEIVDSVNQTIKERIANHMYGTFFLSWCFINWRAVYATIFVDSEILLERTLMLKDEYVMSLYQINNEISVIYSLWKLILLPIILMYFTIWILSKIDLMVFRKSYSCKIDKIVEQRRQDNRMLGEEKSTIKKETEVLKAKGRKLEAKKKVERTQEDEWENEYITFGKTRLFIKAIKELRTCIYDKDGRKKEDYGEGVFVDPNNLSFLDVNGLIEDPNSDRLRMTDKGKYFMKMHVNDVR